MTTISQTRLLPSYPSDAMDQQLQLGQLEIPSGSPASESHKIAAFALTQHGTKSRAIDFLERDIERHESQWKTDCLEAQKERERNVRGMGYLVKDPRRPKKKMEVLREAIMVLTGGGG